MGVTNFWKQSGFLAHPVHETAHILSSQSWKWADGAEDYWLTNIVWWKCAHDIDCCQQSSGETCRHVEQIVAVRCSETTTTDQSAFSWRLWQPSRRSLSYVSRCTGVLRWRDSQPVYCVSGNFHPSWASSGSTATAWHVTRRLQVATLLLLCSYFTGLPLQLMCTY